MCGYRAGAAAPALATVSPGCIAPNTPPSSPQTVAPSNGVASLSVAVRVRPVLSSEAAGKKNRRDIVRVLDEQVVVILDPDESKVWT